MRQGANRRRQAGDRLRGEDYRLTGSDVARMWLLHDTGPGGGMVDALASGASVRMDVEVRVLSWAPNFILNY